MTIYAGIDENGIIQSQVWNNDPPDVEGPTRASMLEGCFPLIRIIPERVRKPVGMSPTAQLFWNDGSPEWRETLPLPDLKARSLQEVDALADAARAKVLAAPTNSVEYSLTEADARAFKAAGYEGPAPSGVSTWVHAKRRQGWTAQQAADDIIATADAWKDLLWFVRGHRLDTKELIRDADTVFQVEMLLEAFKAGLTAAVGGLQ